MTATHPLSRTRRRQRNNNDQRDLARWAKALGHPARIAILQFLATRQTCFCGQIVEHLPLAQSTVSQHLRELRDAGLIQGTVDGARVCYCLAPETMTKLRAAFSNLFVQLNTAAASCAADECGD